MIFGVSDIGVLFSSRQRNAIAPLSRFDGDGAKPWIDASARRPSGSGWRACVMRRLVAARSCRTTGPRKTGKRGLRRAFAGTRDSRASAHVELAGVDHVAVLRHLDAVAAGRPAVGVADVEVGGLRTGGNVLGFFGDRLVAVQVGPLRDQAARRGAVGGDR